MNTQSSTATKGEMMSLDTVEADGNALVAKKVTSADIKIGIRSSYSSGYQTFFEVGNDTGSRVRRHADAVAIGIWPSTGHLVHGFEVKVSRGDFLAEMKDGLKSQEIFRFCNRWSLATPPGLVKVDELPPTWGLVTFDGRTLRTVKQAPRLTPEPLTPGFVAALVRRAGEMDAGVIGAAVAKAKSEIEKNYQARAAHALASHRDDSIRAGQEAAKIVAGFKEALGEDWLSVHSVSEIAPLLKAMRKTGIVGNYRGVESLADELVASAERIRKAFTDSGMTLGEVDRLHKLTTGKHA